MALDYPGDRSIWYSPYQLRANGFLNSISARREFEGALIRIGDGYGCLHPWPELGDPPLGKCLEDLRVRRFWPIVRRAMRCAQFDEAARNQEESLFEEMEVPRSHATIVRGDAAELEAAVEAGFSIVKMKAGRNLSSETALLEEMAGRFGGLKWRLDFNESLSPEDAEGFLGGLSEKARLMLDFVEDICPFSETTWTDLWKRHRVRLAVDMESGPQRKAAQITVIKPAVDEPFLLGEAAMMNGQRAVVTSYMDHPLGQAFAAYEAARTEVIFPGLVGICGLQTHHLFEKDAFTEALGEWGPEFKVPEGMGLGFDDALAGMTWVKL